jgi:DNA-binding NtrC family response regulator
LAGEVALKNKGTMKVLGVFATSSETIRHNPKKSFGNIRKVVCSILQSLCKRKGGRGVAMAKGKILVVEDDELTNLLISKMLDNHEFEVISARSVPEALLCLSRNPVDVVLSDIEMSPIRGVELLTRIPFDLPYPRPLVVFMTSKGSLSSACETLAQGAFDYIGKPVHIESLLRVLERALRQQLDVAKGNVKSSGRPDFGLIGSSPKMAELYKNVARAAFSDSNVFIWAESGTGKELIARAIHENSPRKENRFVTVNCGALTETLLESELFGHLMTYYFKNLRAAAERGISLAESTVQVLLNYEWPGNIRVVSIQLCEIRQVG